MPLTNQQIERYSRQIIVSGIGGIGQERLLGCRLMLAGSLADAGPVLACMAGAGVGAIDVLTGGPDAARRTLVDRMRRLNSDVTIRSCDHPAAKPDLTLAIIGDGESLELARAVCDSNGIIVLVRLDSPARIALFPSRPPCPVCADPDLLARFGAAAENAGFVAMAAATLALKALAQAGAVAPAPTLIEFDGYRATPSRIKRRSGASACSCRNGGTS